MLSIVNTTTRFCPALMRPGQETTYRLGREALAGQVDASRQHCHGDIAAIGHTMSGDDVRDNLAGPPQADIILIDMLNSLYELFDGLADALFHCRLI